MILRRWHASEQRLEIRAVAVGNGFDARDRLQRGRSVKSRIFSERAFLDFLGEVRFELDDELGARRNLDVNGFRTHKLDRTTAQPAGNFKVVGLFGNFNRTRVGDNGVDPNRNSGRKGFLPLLRAFAMFLANR